MANFDLNDFDPEPISDERVQRILDEYQEIPADRRETVLSDADHRCQVDGRRDRTHGGHAHVLVQRIHDDPAHCARHDPDNLIAVCLNCAVWIARKPSTEDLHLSIHSQLRDLSISQNWIEIVQYLARHGPSTPNELFETIGLTRSAVHRALEGLMSLDIHEESVDERVVVKDRSKPLYALKEQIPPEQRARGQVPLSPDARRTRILDEVAQRVDVALPDSVDSHTVVAEVVGRKPRNVPLMIRRAQAYQFPFTEWASSESPRRDGPAVTEALDTVVNSTTNVSRRLVGETVSALLEEHDETDLAEDVTDWVEHERQPLTTGSSDQETSIGLVDLIDTESGREPATDVLTDGDGSQSHDDTGDDDDGDDPGTSPVTRLD